MPAPLHVADPILTDRLDLRRPSAADLDDLHAVSSDPRLWLHYPAKRRVEPSETAEVIERWRREWEADGLSTWAVRVRGHDRVIGYGGCGKLGGGVVWNLGYRLAADQHGHGYATELAAEAMRMARLVDPDAPIVAYLLEHNTASARVATKLGMALVHRGPDAGNPDPAAIRLVYADRPLAPDELAAAMA
ncbi:GNAT family N-acetyltransferase [Agromyces aurantiacus]|uniref:GNAT family N-acetyltransferase n=1 Tax=Agromyces aurantiacus TaxID=165814 RepID=A0ABV9R4C8_9MICO|nr:GNAT family N-acetyltransferase [Agromyces aurantiacus]MBM7503671.1 RimJ/RimL family protein N-acetyltransferase [Agromyces aurantiacus]